MMFAQPLDRLDMRITSAILAVMTFTLLDCILTLDLIGQGAFELNPIMAFYINEGPTAFVAVKYLLTSASVFLILAVKETRCFWGKMPVRGLLLFHLFILAAVINKQLWMKMFGLT